MHRWRASVREMVAFTFHGHDLTPGMGLARLREGAIAHRLRQQSAGEALVEYAVSARLVTDWVELTVSGRIDRLSFRYGMPVIEEIKLSEEPPEEGDEAHFSQAMCYGHMLCQAEGHEQVILRVFYARKDGSQSAAFERQRDRAWLAESFAALAAPYLAYLDGEARYQTERDEALRLLAFPYGTYRDGQRALAAQTYWAIRERKRLVAQAPTGIGKTCAVLYPALKALGRGLTEQVYYLTARGTARQAAQDALDLMVAQGAKLRCLTLIARDKCCPHSKERHGGRCEPLECPEAIGFFDRLEQAMPELLRTGDWSPGFVRDAARQWQLCPFELSLTLAEEADVVLCDYNYAFDPGVRLKRTFQTRRPVTLLVDEAHNLVDRSREMLSAGLESGILRAVRREAGKVLGRKSPLYKSLTALLNGLEAIVAWEPRLEELPEAVSKAVPDALDSALEALRHAMIAGLGDCAFMLFGVQVAMERDPAQYAWLYEKEAKNIKLTWLCLDPAPHLAACTKPLRGCVYFSATLSPLSAMRNQLGGTREDGLLSLPSPYPQEHLLVLRRALSTRFRQRERTADAVAQSIVSCVRARPGNYWACFPSYKYLNMVREALTRRAPELTLLVQSGRMDDAAREAFLERFQPSGECLGMVVLGGAFGESVDLPGERLNGVIIVGVGLPQISPEREVLREYYEETLGDGFGYAYRYPGMHKVLQAVGRVIRSETDRGVALLIDDRFLTEEHVDLMPPHWGQAPCVTGDKDMRARLAEFWAEGDG